MPGARQTEAERREAILRATYRVAKRDQLGGLTMRAVAEEAGVSKGLVFFYFDDRDTLLLSLLDWLLETTLVLDGELEGVEAEADPARRLMDVLAREIAKLPQDRARAELFMGYWVLGQGRPEIQRRIRAAFDRYRAAFLRYTEPVVARSPERFGPDGARGLASVVVSFIEGCALQLISDPKRVDVDRYTRALSGLVLP